MTSERGISYVYYFFLPEEENKFLVLVRDLSALPLPDYRPSEKELDTALTRYYFLSLDKLRILVLRFIWDSAFTLDIESWLKEIEHKASLSGDNMVGKVVLSVSDANVRTGPPKSSKTGAVRFMVDGMELTRLRNAGAGYETFYEVRTNSEKQRQAHRIMERVLPFVEAYLAEIHLLSNTYKDSAQTVLQQVSESGRRLSHILYSQTKGQVEDTKAIRELEDQLHELSVSYGQLVSNYNFLREGRSKIQELSERLKQHLRTEMSITSGDTGSLDLTTAYQPAWRLIERALGELQSSVDNHRAAIEVVRGRIEILMSRESASLQSRIRDVLELNTSLQKQSLTFQVAASFIEFIVLAYYTHSLWKNLAPGAYANVAKWLQFLLTSLLAGTAVYVTHLIAEHIQGEHHVNRRLKIVIGILVLIFAVIIGLSVAYSGKGIPASH